MEIGCKGILRRIRFFWNLVLGRINTANKTKNRNLVIDKSIAAPLIFINRFLEQILSVILSNTGLLHLKAY